MPSAVLARNGPRQLALLLQSLTARSIIEVSLGPLNLTGQAQHWLGKRTGKRLAVLLA